MGCILSPAGARGVIFPVGSESADANCRRAMDSTNHGVRNSHAGCVLGLWMGKDGRGLWVRSVLYYMRCLLGVRVLRAMSLVAELIDWDC